MYTTQKWNPGYATDPNQYHWSSSGLATSVSELLYPCYFTLLTLNVSISVIGDTANMIHAAGKTEGHAAENTHSLRHFALLEGMDRIGLRERELKLNGRFGQDCGCHFTSIFLVEVTAGGEKRNLPRIVMAALWNRARHYIFVLWFVSSSSFYLFSSPNLSGRRLDVYHTSTHGVALVRI